MIAYDTLGLLLVMSALAAIPSASVALVVVRSATVNVRNGIATAVGVVVGDLIFIAMAMMGLVALSEIMGAFFAVVRYLAAGYLVWVGWQLIRRGADTRVVNAGQVKGGGDQFSIRTGADPGRYQGYPVLRELVSRLCRYRVPDNVQCCTHYAGDGRCRWWSQGCLCTGGQSDCLSIERRCISAGGQSRRRWPAGGGGRLSHCEGLKVLCGLDS